jgi:hypothetical protein
MNNEPFYARDIKPGQVVSLWRRGEMRELTVEAVYNMARTTAIYYAEEKTPDMVRPWDDFSKNIVR